MRDRWIDESRLIAVKGDLVKVRGEGQGEAVPQTASASHQKAQDASRPKFDSKLERDYSYYLTALKFAGEILDFYYHTVVLTIPGGQRYTPDFMVWTKDLKPEIHEVKGSALMKNARDGITRLKVAAGTFKCFTFKLIYRRKGEWEIKIV